MNEPNITRLFPKWHIVGVLGDGGSGRLYEIEREQFGKREKAALKVVRIPRDDSVIAEYRAEGYSDDSIRKHFKDELDAFSAEYNNMRKLTHTNIVNCDDIEYEYLNGGMCYLIYIKMELLTPLNTAVQNLRDPERVAVKLGKDICSALQLCENRNIVHRDIKPQNLFVNEYGEYKLGNFGIAREMTHVTHASVAGSYRYMSPEVFAHRAYNHNVDVYSLGLVLYWLLNEKRLPFMPLTSDVVPFSVEEQAIFRRLGGEPFAPPKNGSPQLKRIVMKACEADRTMRYQSARDMLADLRALEGNAERGFVLQGSPYEIAGDRQAPVGAMGANSPEAYRAPQQAQEQRGENNHAAAAAETQEAPAEKKAHAPGIGAGLFGYYSVVLTIMMIATVGLIVLGFFTNLSNFGLGGAVYLVNIGLLVLSGIAYYNRNQIGSAAMRAGAIIFSILLTGWSGFVVNTVPAALQIKAETPVVENDHVILDTSVKADKVYKYMENHEEEDLEKHFGGKWFDIKNCTFGNYLNPLLDPDGKIQTYQFNVQLEGKWYEVYINNTESQLDRYEKLRKMEACDLVCSAQELYQYDINGNSSESTVLWLFSGKAAE